MLIQVSASRGISTEGLSEWQVEFGRVRLIYSRNQHYTDLGPKEAEVFIRTVRSNLPDGASKWCCDDALVKLGGGQ